MSPAGSMPGSADEAMFMDVHRYSWVLMGGFCCQ